MEACYNNFFIMSKEWQKTFPKVKTCVIQLVINAKIQSLFMWIFFKGFLTLDCIFDDIVKIVSDE